MYLESYHGEHSVIFGDKHTWKDWHLIPAYPPVIPPPKVRTNYVDIPGTNGSLDVSEMLTGYPMFENRTGSMQFVFLSAEFGSSRDMYTEMLNTLHGRNVKVILTDEPEYFYEGRVSVKEYSVARDHSEFSFDYTFAPYKIQTHASPGYKDLDVDGERVIKINIGTSLMRVVPTISVTANEDMTAVLERPGKAPVTVTLVHNASLRYPGLTIGPGGGKLTVTGTGVISLDIRGGSL